MRTPLDPDGYLSVVRAQASTLLKVVDSIRLWYCGAGFVNPVLSDSSKAQENIVAGLERLKHPFGSLYHVHLMKAVVEILERAKEVAQGGMI